MSTTGAHNGGLSSSLANGATTLPPIKFDNFPRRPSIAALHTSSQPPPRPTIPNPPDISPRLSVTSSSPHAVRPTSPYRFGSASSTTDNTQLRRLLHSPDQSHHSVSGPSQNQLDVDMDENRLDPHSSRHRSSTDSPHFDYSMRRHSIATVQHDDMRAPSPSDRLRRTQMTGSLKRKISHDRIMYTSVGEEDGPDGDMLVDPAEPAPKRRGSTFDTRIAQLSLYDRRDSVDSRSPASQVWQSDRRDSTASAFSTASSIGTGYTSGFSTDSNVKSLPSYSWAANQGSSGSESHENEATPSPGARGSSIPGDLPPPSELHSMPTVPSMHPYAADRRMSVPENPSRIMDRSLRSRSRPPMSTRGVESVASPKQRDPLELPSIRASDSQQQQQLQRDPTPTAGDTPKEMSGSLSGTNLGLPSSLSNTPYSRSPELRVSHKLAERKRRKEMKDLFDELREHLPADRGMKASKWEILSKAVDYIQQLKHSEANMQREVEVLRHELDTVRQSAAQFAGGLQASGVGHPIVYTQGPPMAPYPPNTVNAGGRGAVMHGYGHPPGSVGNGTPPI
ncbi:hypothetical protein BKA62DRAFT_766309 [Auriculariales sp. MPI-PUGE-AT-0066]|nr:hypothetical protein BKA62DRAFT_766309 [Auriculariales sp. MPI-PUGE-AT-0066]